MAIRIWQLNVPDAQEKYKQYLHTSRSLVPNNRLYGFDLKAHELLNRLLIFQQNFEHNQQNLIFVHYIIYNKEHCWQAKYRYITKCLWLICSEIFAKCFFNILNLFLLQPFLCVAYFLLLGWYFYPHLLGMNCSRFIKKCWDTNTSINFGYIT